MGGTLPVAAGSLAGFGLAAQLAAVVSESAMAVSGGGPGVNVMYSVFVFSLWMRFE
jgi:hypothetical protein